MELVVGIAEHLTEDDDPLQAYVQFLNESIDKSHEEKIRGLVCPLLEWNIKNFFSSFSNMLIWFRLARNGSMRYQPSRKSLVTWKPFIEPYLVPCIRLIYRIYG